MFKFDKEKGNWSFKLTKTLHYNAHRCIHYPIFLGRKTQGNLKNCESDVIWSRIYTLLNHNLPFCSARCDRALNRWMNENSYLDCCLSCKLLKFGATLASVTGENYLVFEAPVKFSKVKSWGVTVASLCPADTVDWDWKCIALVFQMLVELKSSFDADCSGSCMLVVFFVQG